MNTNQIINLIVFLSFIGAIITIVYLNKKIKDIRYDCIKNQINKSNASNKQIEMAYHYETGNYHYTINKEDGTELEYKVFKTLYKCGGKVLSSLYTKGKCSNTNESDIVFVHNTGIYVIECKDTNAVSIEGSEYEDDWEYVFNKNYKKERRNALIQNLGHINSIIIALNNEYPSKCYVSLVVINCKNINVAYQSNSRNFYQNIVTPSKLKSHIKAIISERKEILTDDEVMEIYRNLHENYSNVSEEIKRNHIDNIEKRKTYNI